MKKRLDILVHEAGLAESREKAKALIMAGQIYIKHQKFDKPGEQIDESCQIECRGRRLQYVSRGGLKIEKATQKFGILLDHLVCMDIGASTGGFTDFMLQNGAKKVYSVDVGYGQLAWKLRTDERVINLERTNARYLTTEQVPNPIDFTSIDVSFISLTKILPTIRKLLIPKTGRIVALIKPQFEAGREFVGKKGVVREVQTHINVIEKILLFSLSAGFSILGLTFSPIKGPEGNIEYLIYLQKSEGPHTLDGVPVAREIAEASHIELDV